MAGAGETFPEMSREVRLVLECARTRLTAAHVERIENLLRPDTNWAAVLHFTEESALVPLVFENLRRIASRVPVLVPAIWMERLGKSCRTNTTRSLYQSSELVKILDALESRGILAIAYKGPVLAVQAYGDAGLRQFYDLDVVVQQKDLPAVDQALRSIDFGARFSWPRVENPRLTQTPGEYTYRGQHSGILLEVHTERTMRHFPVPVDLGVLAARVVRINLAGRTVKTFCPEDALPILCVHGAKDFWAKASNVVDIAELVQLQPFDWNLARETARSLRCTTMMLLGLSLAQRLIGAPLPNSVAEEVYANRDVAAMTREIARRLDPERTYRWNFVKRGWYRARLVDPETNSAGYLWRLAVSPPEDAWSPGHISPLSTLMQRFIAGSSREGKGKPKPRVDL
jgi:Uncharacterised nucleotidyltransferase